MVCLLWWSQVDGLGNALVDFDDPNLPNLLAMPILGFEYDAQVWLKGARPRFCHDVRSIPQFEGSNAQLWCSEGWYDGSSMHTGNTRSVCASQPVAQGVTYQYMPLSTDASQLRVCPLNMCVAAVAPPGHQVYAATRKRILSHANAFYFEGSSFTGLGSPHSPDRYIWPLAHMVDALTTELTTAGAQAV